MDHHKIMTEEEAEALDDFFTKNTVMPCSGKGGVLTRMGLLSGELDPDVTEYLRIQAAATHRTQAQIIGDLVRERVAASA
ncbi:hypothetical protein AGMMS49928_01440 [Spirochaetia bacterium]|nr:hypothetical protein AGMMS49928_01440 [Spirochaetia bacterium]